MTASRSERPHLARLRAAGDAMELVATDLALDAAGARQIFSAEQVGLSPEQAAAVAERTEGWPVGLYLAAMVAREGHGLAGAVSGDDRYVADYLYHESLARLPEEVQQFLRRTAVLDQLSGPLCDAVLESSGSADQLRRLEASSLFVVALDRRREWYRYHALFREFLMGELRRAQSADIEELHLRAADWYESNGSRSFGVGAPAAHGRARPHGAAVGQDHGLDVPERAAVDLASVALHCGRGRHQELPSARRTSCLWGHLGRGHQGGRAVGGVRRCHLV